MAQSNTNTLRFNSGEEITFQNIGNGTGVFARREASTMSFRSLIAGEGLKIQRVGDNIVFTNTLALDKPFTSLSDVPNSYTGANGKILMVNEATGSIDFVDVPVNHGAFTDLQDTPLNYDGHDGKFLTVNAITSKIEFTDLVGGRIEPIEESITSLEDRIGVLENLASVEFGSTPPSDPDIGDFWLNADEGTLYVFYDNGGQGIWIESGGSDPAAPNLKPYDYGGAFEGTPTSRQVIYRWRPPRTHLLRDEFAGCSFTAETLPTSTFSCKVFVNNVHVGDWHISTLGNFTLATLAGSVHVPAHSEVKIVAPAVVDPTIKGICMVFAGER